MSSEEFAQICPRLPRPYPKLFRVADPQLPKTEVSVPASLNLSLDERENCSNRLEITDAGTTRVKPTTTLFNS